MKKKGVLAAILAAVLCISGNLLAVCPTMDVTGDCKVNLADFAIFAGQWMTEGLPEPDITWVSITDTGAGMRDFFGEPVSQGGFVGQMSKYETTNAQYCQFLNAALVSGDIIVISDIYVAGANGSNPGADFAGEYYYHLYGYGFSDTTTGVTNGGASRINWTGTAFTVDAGFENHPVTYVSWYGATAFCNYYGYSLPTEWQWQAVADYSGIYTYGCGKSIDKDIANYYPTTHPDGTTAAGSLGVYGYGVADMAASVEEWTTSCYHADCSYGWLVSRGGYWHGQANQSTVFARSSPLPGSMSCYCGFRVCRIMAPPQIMVPDVTGMSQADAESAISNAGLVVGAVSKLFSNTVAVDHVINQNPACGQSIPVGITVELTVSSVAVTWVTINDTGAGMHDQNYNPISQGGFTGQMSKYETTNAQYAQYLNDARASGDIIISGSYVVGASGSNSGADFAGENYYNLAGSGTTYNGATNGGAARINWTGTAFTVDAGFENHPVTYVSWYGATAFANYYGWRLPTQWEWQAVADYSSTYNQSYGCGETINNSKANIFNSNHPDGTTTVGAFGAYGYGMADMAGNAWEWTESLYISGNRILRGGCWYYYAAQCAVWDWSNDSQGTMYYFIGFRVCR
jgi:formylglycine-generating enzyme required for sulfatase activity